LADSSEHVGLFSPFAGIILPKIGDIEIDESRIEAKNSSCQELDIMFEGKFKTEKRLHVIS